MGCGVTTSGVSDGVSDEMHYTQFVRTSWDACPLCGASVSNGQVQEKTEVSLSPESPLARRLWWRSRWSTAPSEMGALELLPPPDLPETLLLAQKSPGPARVARGAGHRPQEADCLAAIRKIPAREAQALGISTWRLQMAEDVKAVMDLTDASRFPRRQPPLMREGVTVRKVEGTAPGPEPSPSTSPGIPSCRPHSPDSPAMATSLQWSGAAPCVSKKNRLKEELRAVGEPARAAEKRRRGAWHVTATRVPARLAPLAHALTGMGKPDL